MKLLSLNKYDNVNLYPNAKRQKFISLYKSCDIYLDINYLLRLNNFIDISVKAAT
jgi:hypothetical protein